MVNIGDDSSNLHRIIQSNFVTKIEENDEERQPLKDEICTVIEEARMLRLEFKHCSGFKPSRCLTANSMSFRTAHGLTHLVELVFLTLSMGLIMTPAAYNRFCFFA